jgi:excinuclease ABC subunit C
VLPYLETPTGRAYSRMQLAYHHPFDAVNDEAVQALPEGPGVIRLDLSEAAPYVGRARNLRRRLPRLQRLFGDRVMQARYQPVGSSFEANTVLVQTARDAWPTNYRERLRLRPAVVVKALVSNQFPRLSVSSRISGGGLFYGPFRSRVFAERFEESLLDFFQVRRCSENLEPSPDHPGCVFGEIGKCLRPCQEAANDEEYRAEFGRLLRAMESSGESLVADIELERNDASEQLDFEKAKSLHERAMAARKLFLSTPEAMDLDRLHGVVVQKGVRPMSIALFPLSGGCLQPKIELELQIADAGSLDQRLRESIEAAEFETRSATARQDSLAITSRWLFSSWSVGEFLPIPSFDKIPYRKLVNAVSRVAQGRTKR